MGEFSWLSNYVWAGQSFGFGFWLLKQPLRPGARVPHARFPIVRDPLQRRRTAHVAPLAAGQRLESGARLPAHLQRRSEEFPQHLFDRPPSRGRIGPFHFEYGNLVRPWL